MTRKTETNHFTMIAGTEETVTVTAEAPVEATIIVITEVQAEGTTAERLHEIAIVTETGIGIGTVVVVMRETIGTENGIPEIVMSSVSTRMPSTETQTAEVRRVGVMQVAVKCD